MVLVFLVLSIIVCIITLNVWRNRDHIELKSNLVALSLGLTAFNTIFGLILLFDGLESNPDNLIHELVQHPGTLGKLILCLANALFYSVFTLLFFVWPHQPNQRG